MAGRKKISPSTRRRAPHRPERAAKVISRSEQPVPPPPVSPLTHINQRGEARMVDVTQKGATERTAGAEGRVIMRKESPAVVLQGNAVRDAVLGEARLAGIMAAKRAHGLITLCHPLPLKKVEIDINP